MAWSRTMVVASKSRASPARAPASGSYCRWRRGAGPAVKARGERAPSGTVDPGGRNIIRGPRPVAHNAVLGSSQHAVPVGMEADGGQGGVVLRGRSDGLARAGMPEAGRLVGAAGDKRAVVGAERHGMDRALVDRGPADGQPRPRRPN